MGAHIIQELLGWQPSLGSAIVAMFDFAEGKFDASKSDAREQVEMLCSLFAQRLLPHSQNSMLDRALTQLRSANPLSRQEPKKEMEEYQKVLLRLMTANGLIGGSMTAEAITVRSTRFVEQGGAAGRRAAIGHAVRALPDTANGVVYLAELTKTEFAENHLNDMIGQLDLVFSARVITELCRRAASPSERMQTVTKAFKAAMSSAFPDDTKKKVAEHIDTVLERYLIEEKIIERLDNPADLLRNRATRLVKFAGAGVLPEGKALALARRHIIGILRQPGFEEKFIEGLPDAATANKALMDFHKLLKSTGFA
jgi:hypothetical protein